VDLGAEVGVVVFGLVPMPEAEDEEVVEVQNQPMLKTKIKTTD